MGSQQLGADVNHKQEVSMIGVYDIGHGQHTGGRRISTESREKQHHVLVFAPMLDGVVDPSCRIISPTVIIIRPSSPLARLAFGTSDCASRYSLFQLSEFLGENSCTWWRQTYWVVGW